MQRSLRKLLSSFMSRLHGRELENARGAESMYQIEGTRAFLQTGAGLLRGRLPHVSRNVLLLGLVSFFTDVSSEMVATVLPLYVVYSLGLSPLAYGAIEGAYQGGAALVRLGGGFAADRLGRYKATAAVGYGVSAATRPLFLVVGGSVGGLTTLVVTDRVGKAIRTAPRDALIALSSERERLATAFGVHRALDTAGAMLGPLLAFLLLVIAPLDFESIFVVSTCFGVVGFAILVLFVQERGSPAVAVSPLTQAEREPVSVRAALALVRLARYRAFVVAGGVLALTTVSDGFLYLSMRERLGFDVRFLPLLFVGTALVYMLTAIPVGRLADRVGRRQVFLAGHGFLFLVYVSLVLPSFGPAELVLLLAALGLFYAATDGVLMAASSSSLPDQLRGSGFAALVATTTTARLAGAVLFGGLWTWFSLNTAIAVFACGLAVAIPVAAVILSRPSERANPRDGST